MKKLKTKWLIWTSRVLSAAVALLGVASCSLFRRVAPPCMYGVPDFRRDSIDTLKQPPVFKAMYGVTPVTYQSMNQIDEGGVDIEVNQK